MGLLDDAIREHLDLKRRRGADPTEVEREEREVLGPVRRRGEPAPDDELLAHMPEEDLEDEPLPHLDEEWDEYEEPAAEAAPAPSAGAFDHEQVAPQAPEPYAVPAPAPYAAPRPQAAPETERYETSEPYSAPKPEPYAAPEPEPYPAPASEPYAAPEPSRYAEAEQDLYAEPEHERRPEPPRADLPHEPPLDEQTAEFNVQELIEADEPPGPGSPEEEDVLEETPEFLQDTPDHDRLWFEQRPPRDFDFDD